MDFAVVDVETANASLASICQIGIAAFNDGHVQDSWVSLVNPEDYFDPINISIHGIDEETVQFSPTWDLVFPHVHGLLSACVVVSHTAFDRVSITRACEKAGLSPVQFCWLDSAKVVRRTWTSLARRGYGLSNVAAMLGIQYRPHDALEDACCAGEILVRAVKETGLNVQQWLERVKHPTGVSDSSEIVRQGRSDAPLHGEVVVFTGALSLVRREAADLAAAAGCDVDASVTKRTTLLVVGDQDVRKLHGHEKSSKHRKAEELAKAGEPIRIVSQSDFLAITSLGFPHIASN